MTKNDEIKTKKVHTHVCPNCMATMETTDTLQCNGFAICTAQCNDCGTIVWFHLDKDGKYVKEADICWTPPEEEGSDEDEEDSSE